ADVLDVPDEYGGQDTNGGKRGHDEMPELGTTVTHHVQRFCKLWPVRNSSTGFFAAGSTLEAGPGHGQYGCARRDARGPALHQDFAGRVPDLVRPRQRVCGH